MAPLMFVVLIVLVLASPALATSRSLTESLGLHSARHLADGGYSVGVTRKAGDPQRRTRAIQTFLTQAGPGAVPVGFGPGPAFTLNNGFGAYYIGIEVGTPGQPSFPLIDTGSPVNWVTCSTCLSGGPLNSGCTGPVFDPSQSSTVNTNLTCDQCSGDMQQLEGCDTTRYLAPRFGGEFDDAYAVLTSTVLTPCKFYVNYGNTFDFGPVYSDVLKLGNIRAPSFVFGCATQTSSDLAALVGLSPSPISLQNKLARSGAIPSNIFATCFSPTGGQLFLGTIPSISNLQVSYVPVIDPGRWDIANPVGFLVNGIPVDPTSLGNPDDTYNVDSGTSVTTLPRDVINQIGSLMVDFAGNKFGPMILLADFIMTFDLKDTLGPNPTRDDIAPFFPPLTFLLPGGAILTVGPQDYLEINQDEFLTGEVTNYVYTGLASAIPGVFDGYPYTIGATFLIGQMAIFDQTNQRIGFAPTDCNTLTAKTVPNSVTSACDPSSTYKFQCYNAAGSAFVCCSDPCVSPPGASPTCASTPAISTDAPTPTDSPGTEPEPTPFDSSRPYNPPAPIEPLIDFPVAPPGPPGATKGPLDPCDPTSNLPYQCFNSAGNASVCCPTTCTQTPSGTPSCSVVGAAGPTPCDPYSAKATTCYSSDGGNFVCCAGGCVAGQAACA